MRLSILFLLPFVSVGGSFTLCPCAVALAVGGCFEDVSFLAFRVGLGQVAFCPLSTARCRGALEMGLAPQLLRKTPSGA